MLSTIEKVILLKSVNIFAQVPDYTLAALATILEDIEVAAGEVIFRKGEMGTAMYIIVVGEVRVHDGDHTFARMGPREVFGEMALFDAEPRSASISAIEDTQLLYLNQEDFFDLLEEHSIIARGVIQVLSQRLRARTEDVRRLSVQTEPVPEPIAEDST